MTMPQPPPSPLTQFFGVMLIIAGILIALLCGLCTLVVLGLGLSGPGSGRGIVGVALILGGVPTVVGGLLVWAGIAVLRSGRERPPKVKLDTFD